MKKKTIVIGILCISVIIVLYLISLKIRKTENPIIAELQAMIEKEVGTDYQISKGELYSEGPFHTISIYADRETYNKESALIDINKIQQLIYNYVREHKEHFILDYVFEDEMLGFRVDFVDRDAAAALQTFATFTNYIQSEDTFHDKYVSLSISLLGGYPYKLSDFTTFENVMELELARVEIDDETELKKINNLKYLRVLTFLSEEDMKKTKKAAKEYGIELYSSQG